MLATGQSSTAEDAARASEVVASVYSQLRKEMRLPFAVSAVEEWAQPALINLSALELCAEYGISGGRLQAVAELARKGRVDLAAQMFAMRHPSPIKAHYF